MNVIQAFVQLNLLPIWKRRVRVWDFDFTAPSLDRLTALYLHRIRFLGEEEKHFFENHLKPGMTVVDIGANQGLYTTLFSKLVGNTGAVISFEPEADMYQALVKNLKQNRISNVQPHKLALGSETGVATLSRSLVHAGDNRLASGHSKNTARPESVSVTTLDEVVGNKPVDFIKMDVQGWEGEVFRGMQGVLERNRNLNTYFEFWPHGLRVAGCDPIHLLQSFSQLGFHLFEMGNGEQRPVRDFAELITRLPKKKFTNLLARR